MMPTDDKAPKTEEEQPKPTPVEKAKGAEGSELSDTDLGSVSGGLGSFGPVRIVDDESCFTQF